MYDIIRQELDKESGWWWLRSAYNNYEKYVGYCSCGNGGYISRDICTVDDYGIIPVCIL